MVKQRTLKQIINATGVGVHSGRKVTIALRPAPVDTGIVFSRVDLDPVASIPATVDYVKDTRLCTSLIKGDVRIATIEHLMSALAGLGIDNAFIDVDAAEIPIMDGSAAPFVFLIKSAGIEEQNKAKRFIRIKEEIKVKDGDKWASLKPYEGFKVNFTLEYNHPCFNERPQSASVDFSSESFVKQVSRARTFGFVSELEQLRKMNLAKGASLDNAIAIDNFRILNPDGLRYDDEFAKHKILDAIGDMYTIGASIIGEFTGHKAGHAINNQLLHAVLKQKTAWDYVTFEEQTKSPITFFEPAFSKS